MHCIGDFFYLVMILFLFVYYNMVEKYRVK